MTPKTPLEYYAETGALPVPEPEYELVLYWLWLAEMLGAANLHTGRVLDEFGSARAVYAHRGEAALTAAAGRAAAARIASDPRTPADFAARAAYCRAHGIRILTFEDPDYPLALSRIPDPPAVLYLTGDAGLLNGRATVGMVGTRRPTQYGVAAAAHLGGALARAGAVIVSGLADGLDGESHRAALAAGAPTIGVLGVPIDRTYPAANAALRRRIDAGGAVLSEYAPGEVCDYRCTFLQRNRMIAALSLVLLVVEARTKSGTMSTVAHAERYGRPIYAVPGSIFSPLSEGTNALLREGRARAAVDGEDLLRELGLAPVRAPQPEPPAEAQPLTDNARRVLACVGAVPVGLDTLGEQTGLPMGALLSALTGLELAGRITAQPGRHYVLK